MLVLTRKIGEQLVIGAGDETVVVRLLGLSHTCARLGIIAPRSVPVHRKEVARRPQESQQDVGELLADSASKS